LGQNVTRFGPKQITFWPKIQPILAQNEFHFAAKRIPFCRKTHSILPQNAFHFAAKRIPFCRKTQIESGGNTQKECSPGRRESILFNVR